jgi:hypothetical protein
VGKAGLQRIPAAAAAAAAAAANPSLGKPNLQETNKYIKKKSTVNATINNARNVTPHILSYQRKSL